MTSTNVTPHSATLFFRSCIVDISKTVLSFFGLEFLYETTLIRRSSLFSFLVVRNWICLWSQSSSIILPSEFKSLTAFLNRNNSGHITVKWETILERGWSEPKLLFSIVEAEHAVHKSTSVDFKIANATETWQVMNLAEVRTLCSRQTSVWESHKKSE